MWGAPTSMLNSPRNNRIAGYCQSFSQWLWILSTSDLKMPSSPPNTLNLKTASSWAVYSCETEIKTFVIMNPLECDHIVSFKFQLWDKYCSLPRFAWSWKSSNSFIITFPKFSNVHDVMYNRQWCSIKGQFYPSHMSVHVTTLLNVFVKSNSPLHDNFDNDDNVWSGWPILKLFGGHQHWQGKLVQIIAKL